MLNRIWKAFVIGACSILLAASTCNGVPASLPLVADAGADQTVGIGDTVLLDASRSTGDILSYTWAFEAMPHGSEAVLAAADEVVASFVADAVGEFVVSLTVSDGGTTAWSTTTVSVAQEANTRLLRPGKSVTGVDGVLIGAADGVFDGELEVFAERALDPTSATPLNSGAEIVSSFYGVGATVTTRAPVDAPFVIGLPVPPGLNTDKLALAVLEPSWHGHLYDSDKMEASWAFVDGFFDAERGLLVATLSQLADFGNTVAVVSADAFSTRPTGIPDAISGAHFHSDEPSFKATCSSGFDEATEECDGAARSAAAQVLEDAYNEFTELGFEEPRLYREPVAVGGTDLTVIYPGPYVIELRPCSEAARPSGVYAPGTARAWACIGSAGVTSRVGETIRHELFHATQWSIRAVGTPEEPIVFEGETDTPGYWRGLAFQSAHPLNRLSYVTISGAGGFAYDFQDDNRSNIFIKRGTLEVTHTVVENSNGHGMLVTAGSSLAGFANNRLASNARSPVVLVAPLIGYLDAATDYDVEGKGNGEPYIRVDRDIDYVQVSQRWAKVNVPYRFQDRHLVQGGTVTIEPGAILEFAEDAALEVREGGGLSADTEGGETIIFRGVRSAQDFWAGLGFFSNR